MTSAPKSDRITAALGPAMKLARSTTFKPEKMLSFAMTGLSSLQVASPPLEARDALFQECGRSFLLVLGCGAEPEVGGLEQQAIALARLQPLVDRLERQLDGDRRVGGDLLHDRFGARDEIGWRHHLIDQADAIGVLRRDHLSTQDELQGATLADQTRQTLGPAATRNESQGDLGLAELCALDGDPDRAGHRGLAAAAQGKAIDGRDHRLAEILDEIE